MTGSAEGDGKRAETLTRASKLIVRSGDASCELDLGSRPRAANPVVLRASQVASEKHHKYSSEPKIRRIPGRG